MGGLMMRMHGLSISFFSLVSAASRALCSIHVNFHRLCYPALKAMIAFFVNPCKYLIDEILPIAFLLLRKMYKLWESSASKKYSDDRFFKPIISNTLGVTLSRPCLTIVSDS
jgi:hypothetical protein